MNAQVIQESCPPTSTVEEEHLRTDDHWYDSETNDKQQPPSRDRSSLALYITIPCIPWDVKSLSLLHSAISTWNTCPRHNHYSVTGGVPMLAIRDACAHWNRQSPARSGLC